MGVACVGFWSRSYCVSSLGWRRTHFVAQAVLRLSAVPVSARSVAPAAVSSCVLTAVPSYYHQLSVSKLTPTWLCSLLWISSVDGEHCVLPSTTLLESCKDCFNGLNWTTYIPFICETFLSPFPRVVYNSKFCFSPAEVEKKNSQRNVKADCLNQIHLISV